MQTSRDQALAEILQFLGRLADDWEYSGEITEETYFLADMGLASLDVVILANSIQEHYGQTFPFPEFFAEIGQRELRDVSVGEWVDFIYKNLNAVTLEKTDQ